MILLGLATSVVSQAADFYVAPGGSAAGDGSINRPWNLLTALNHPPAVKPGDTVWLRGGVYKGIFVSYLTGSPSAPVTLRGYPGERAIIDGSLAGQKVKNVNAFLVKGSYSWVRDFEITNSDPQRVISITGSNPQERRGNGLDVQAQGVKVINMIIYDTGQGIGGFGASPDMEIYGCLVFNNGWKAPDRSHGHGLYLQNNSGYKIVDDNILLGGFGDTMHVYGSSASFLRNFQFRGNAMYNGRLLFGGSSPIENMVFDSNYAYNHWVEFGYGANGNYGLSVTNNYLMAGVNFQNWKSFSMTNNTLFDSAQHSASRVLALTTPAGVAPSAYVMDRNTYYQARTAGDEFYIPGQGGYTFAQWQARGYERNSKYISTTANGMRPTGQTVVVRKNKYDADRANVIIYNWSGNSTVPVDLSSVLNPGDSYELHNSLDYFNDVTTGTYSGGSVFVSMVNRTMALPHGHSSPLGANTFPEFGTFILVRKSGSVRPSVQVSPGTVSLGEGGKQQFTATVSNTSNTAVTWSISPAAGSISASGLYTAPANITSNQTVTVTATSVADGTLSDSATVQLVPAITIGVTTPSSSVTAGGKLQFTASVTGTTNTGVVWSLSSATGTISATGLYTAPASVASTTTVNVTACSMADSKATATVQISVLPSAANPAVNLVVDPGFENLGQGWTGVGYGGRTISSSVYRTGTKSLQIAGSAQYNRTVSQEVAVAPGQTLNLSGWVKTQSLTKALCLELVWLTSTDAVLRTDTAGALSGTASWTNLTRTVTAPAGAAKVRVQVYLPIDSSSAYAWIDDINLR
jgi:hypothetical protein